MPYILYASCKHALSTVRHALAEHIEERDVYFLVVSNLYYLQLDPDGKISNSWVKEKVGICVDVR